MKFKNLLILISSVAYLAPEMLKVDLFFLKKI
jgi:hypothetical protein